MHQKEKDSLKELNELELILKEYVNDFFIKGIKHSKGERIRFYKFLAEYHQKKAEYYKIKQEYSERGYKKAEGIINSFLELQGVQPRLP